MSEWEECKLGDASFEIIDGDRGKNYPKKDEFFENGYCLFLNTKNVTTNGFEFTELNFITKEKDELLRKGKLKRYDLVLTTRGTVGNVGFYNDNVIYDKLRINSGMVIIRPNGIDKDFNYQLFKYLKKDFETFTTGSAQPQLPIRDLKKMSFLLPPLPEQKAIASLLSSLDDKIDLLHRQNKTLEAMAETLFRQWFVEEAKEEWEEGVLHDVISVKGGTTPSTKKSEYWDGDIYWTSPRDLSNHTSVFISDTKRKITERGLEKIGSGLLPIGTVLLSSRAPIGYLAITEIPLAINQGYIAIVCDKMVSNYFIYLWCEANMEGIKNSGNGSVFQEIAKSVFKKISITIPPSPLLDGFDKTVNPVFSKIKTNQQQIRTLEKLRDTLLPKLMSGEVRVRYNEKENCSHEK
ncbi:MAG: restriction endonuclease subunit S [Desulfobacterales bacterium]|nr:restriction endonuclease subunit S [Desulfobacterales bacterium]